MAGIRAEQVNRRRGPRAPTSVGAYNDGRGFQFLAASRYRNFQDSSNRPAYAASGSSESCWTLKIAKSP